MLNVIKKYQEELTAEELGTLIKMSFAIINGKEDTESDIRIVNYLFKTQFKPSAERYIKTLSAKSRAGKMGGRPRKENNEV